jgi:hypothetical protein
MTTPEPTQTTYNDAYEMLKAKLAEWGIDGLGDDVINTLVQGYSPDVATLVLQDTPQYKKRFAANDTRIKAGLPALTPAEYVATERSYISTLRKYGLPEGFYDQQEDFQKWISADVSPEEMDQRAGAARQAYVDASPEVKDQWQQLYGLTPGDAVATFLDEKTALNLLNKRTQAVSISAQAERAFNGQYQLTQARAEELANQGVTQDKAQAGFSSVASRLPRDQFLGRLAGQDFTQTEAENEVLLDDSKAKAERDKIYKAEQGRFNENYLPTTTAALAKNPGNF